MGGGEEANVCDPGGLPSRRFRGHANEMPFDNVTEKTKFENCDLGRHYQQVAVSTRAW